MFPSIDGRKKRYPTKNPLHRNCWIYKRFLELAERLDSLASAGEDTENVESDLKKINVSMFDSDETGYWVDMQGIRVVYRKNKMNRTKS